jgi:hypothetical protein
MVFQEQKESQMIKIREAMISARAHHLNQIQKIQEEIDQESWISFRCGSDYSLTIDYALKVFNQAKYQLIISIIDSIYGTK